MDVRVDLLESRVTYGVFRDCVGGWDEDFDPHVFVFTEADGFLEEFPTGGFGAGELGDVDGAGGGVETHERDDIVVCDGDADGPVVHHVFEDVAWAVCEFREVWGVGFDRVADLHTP